METQVEQLADDRVRLTVEVPAHDVNHAIEHATHDLAGRVKVPGFRPGKVPTKVLMSKIGKERLYSEAVDSHIGNWFWSAVARSRVRPAEQPEYAYELPSSPQEDWRFTAEFAVQPLPDPADWRELEVGKHAVEVPEETVTKQLEALQRTVADLSLVEDRTAQPGDVVVVDIVSDGGFGQRDYVFELGSERLVDEIESAVRGLLPGETREVSWELGDGSQRKGAVTLNELHEKVLPPLDDKVAMSVSEYDTLTELRGDIEARIRERLEEEADAQFRQAAVDELVKASNVQGAGPLVESRARELLNGFVRSLANRGLTPEAYFAATGQTPELLTAQIRAEAAQSVARELALEAVADKAGIVVSDDEVKDLIREQADASDDDAEAMIADIWAHGHQEALRDDLRMRAALDRLAADVKPIDPETHAAREAIWTPDKEKPAGETKLWTPGSEESR